MAVPFVDLTRSGASRPPADIRRRRRTENLGAIISLEIIMQELWNFLQRYHDDRGGKVLDLGAGTRPYAPLYEPFFAAHVSVDHERSPHDITGVSVIASADDLPFEDGEFDCVICTEVLEHCAEPLAVLGEIARVLRPGGSLFLTTPFMRPLHEMPHDYYRYTPSGLRHLAERQALEVESIVPRGEYLAVLLMIALMPLGRTMAALSTRTGVPLSSRRNPVLLLASMLPQHLYFATWRRMRARPSSRLARLYGKSSYYTLGYVTVCVKRAAA